MLIFSSTASVFLSAWSDPESLIQIWGLLVILILIYLETGFFIGLVIPGGDYLLFVAGLLCGTEYLDIPLGVLLSTMMAAAILGDFTGYYKGKWLGPKLFNKEGNRFFKPSYLTKTLTFYERYGIWAFIIGRFMPVIRTLIPMLAGASGFPHMRFALVNVTGAIIWIGTLTPLGYFLGQEYPDLLRYKVYLLIAFVTIASFPMLRIFLKRGNTEK